jgi:hypothetical protein
MNSPPFSEMYSKIEERRSHVLFLSNATNYSPSASTGSSIIRTREETLFDSLCGDGLIFVT